MGRDGTKTRQSILNETQALVLKNGYAGTTVDHILEKTGITKGAFFYHFKSKADLATALIDNFFESDIGELEMVYEKTKPLEKQPIKRLLKFVQWYIDAMSGMSEPYPGCLYASVYNEPDQFPKPLQKKISEAILLWREAFEKMIRAAMKEKKPKIKVDVPSLADHFTVILEGAFVVSKALDEPELTSKALKQFKNYLELLFEMK